MRDTPKLDTTVERSRDVAVLHKAGWINAARHDAGLVFWRGGVFVVSVMTWRGAASGPRPTTSRGVAPRLRSTASAIALDKPVAGRTLTRYSS